MPKDINSLRTEKVALSESSCITVLQIPRASKSNLKYTPIYSIRGLDNLLIDCLLKRKFVKHCGLRPRLFMTLVAIFRKLPIELFPIDV